MLGALGLLAFAILQGATVYRVRGNLMFVFLFLVIGNISDNLGALTGFPGPYGGFR